MCDLGLKLFEYATRQFRPYYDEKNIKILINNILNLKDDKFKKEIIFNLINID